MERSLIHRRQADGGFNTHGYYRFYNDVSSGNTLSSGQARNAHGAINMTIAEHFSSSENWQLFYQQGRYFIRNYDYLGDYQLGLETSSQTIPRLMQRSGDLGQQWSLTKQDDGMWVFTNGLLGNNSALALSEGSKVPSMQSNSQGAAWYIVINESAGAPKDANMYTEVENFEDPVASSTSTTLSATSATATSSLSVASKTTAPSLISATSSPPSPAGSSTSNSDTLAPGAIAGIAIAAVLLVVLSGALGYLLWSRRQKAKKTSTNPPELDSSLVEPKTYYAHHTPYTPNSQYSVGQKPPPTAVSRSELA